MLKQSNSLMIVIALVAVIVVWILLSKSEPFTVNRSDEYGYPGNREARFERARFFKCPDGIKKMIVGKESRADSLGSLQIQCNKSNAILGDKTMINESGGPWTLPSEDSIPTTVKFVDKGWRVNGFNLGTGNPEPDSDYKKNGFKCGSDQTLAGVKVWDANSRNSGTNNRTITGLKFYCKDDDMVTTCNFDKCEEKKAKLRSLDTPFESQYIEECDGCEGNDTFYPELKKIVARTETVSTCDVTNACSDVNKNSAISKKVCNEARPGWSFKVTGCEDSLDYQSNNKKCNYFYCESDSYPKQYLTKVKKLRSGLSYEQSCESANYNNQTDVLSAYCKNYYGSRKWSELKDPTICKDIENIDGNLTCK